MVAFNPFGRDFSDISGCCDEKIRAIAQERARTVLEMCFVDEIWTFVCERHDKVQLMEQNLGFGNDYRTALSNFGLICHPVDLSNI